MTSADGPLDFLIGEFSGIDHLAASPWATAESAPVVATGTTEIGGILVVQRARESREAGPFDVVNVFLSPPGSDEVLLYGFDPLAYPADPAARGRWVDGELVLDRVTERGQSRAVFAPTADGFRWSKQFRRSPDEAWSPVFEGELRRGPT
jgi:hypothetical protein